MSHHTVQQLILEKEQALADLNSVEKSLADLFRRYEKMKEVLEGFRKASNFENTLIVLCGMPVLVSDKPGTDFGDCDK